MSSRPLRNLLLLTLVAIGLVTSGLATRVLSHFPGNRLEWSRIKRTTLTPELENKLGALHDDVFLTFYVTRRERMPSQLRHVESEVVELLDAMARHGRGRVDWRLVDPTDDEDLQRFAARRKVAPVRVRSVAHDRYSEQEVYATLTIEYGPRPPALIEGIGPEHLPRLQQIVLAQLAQLETPRKPVFAVAAAREGLAGLRGFLATKGEVREVDLERGQAIPKDADVLFYVAPQKVESTLLRRLDHFLSVGGSAVVIGSPIDARLDPGLARLDVGPGNEAIDEVLKRFGIRAVPALLIDAKSAGQNLPTGEIGSPFRCGCLTLNQDFQALSRDPRGTILFVAPTPLQLDAERLEALGMRAEVLATTSDETRLLPITSRATIDATNASSVGEPVAKQPLLVWAQPNERFRGTLVAAGSLSLIDDLYFGIDKLANQRTIETIVETLTKDDRLVMRRAGIVKPEPLPELAASSRLFWRFIVVFSFPLALVLVFLVRRSRSSVSGSAAAGVRGRGLALALRVAAGVVVLALAVRAIAGAGIESDWTSRNVNALAPHSAVVAKASSSAVEVEMLFSDDSRLPPELRSPVRALAEELARFRRAGANLAVERVRPEDLDAEARAALEAAGVRATRASSELEEVTTVRSFYAALRITGNGRTEVLPFDRLLDFENAEFRIAYALDRLRTGKRARVAFASDIPRMSAGEAYSLFQQRGLIPPQGKDVYSVSREWLERCEFEVIHVNPRSPQLPSELDALVWMQPRRSVVEMLDVFVGYLYRGGKALVCAQHFSMQARQYRGRDLDFVYWPQPQSPDVEEYYYPDLGIEMKREVLFDHNDFPIALETQLHRSGRREFEVQELAKPFCIRASASRFDRESVMMRGLSDQPFLYGAYFAIDESKLKQFGLSARTLIATSPEAWSFDWKGGWIPHGMMKGPGASLEERKSEKDDIDQVPEKYLGSVPLALDVRGQFPWPKLKFEQPSRTMNADGTTLEESVIPPYPVAEPTAEAKPGRLVMIGQSEMWKDSWLLQLRARFRPEQLLLNAVADLALGSEFAAVMAHRPGNEGFERVSERRVVEWRAFVVFGAAVILVLFALLRMVIEPVLAKTHARRVGGVA